MNMADEPYCIREVSPGRFSVSKAQTAWPILGYVFKNLDDSWAVEYKGNVVPVVYDSHTDAAQALTILAELSRRFEV